MNVETDVTIAVKTFQRPEALLRLLESIRRFYPAVAVHVVDDSERALEPVPDVITRYWHLPFNSLGVSAGRNFSLRHVETEYVLVCDDDMVFGRRTDLGEMLRTLISTRFPRASRATGTFRSTRWASRRGGTPASARSRPSTR